VRVLLLGLVVATLWATGCGGSTYGGLPRDKARAKATEITGDLRAVVRHGRFQFLEISKATIGDQPSWKAEFYFVNPAIEHANPREGAHPPPLFCVYVWGDGSTVRIDGSGKEGC